MEHHQGPQVMQRAAGRMANYGNIWQRGSTDEEIAARATGHTTRCRPIGEGTDLFGDEVQLMKKSLPGPQVNEKQVKKSVGV